MCRKMLCYMCVFCFCFNAQLHNDSLKLPPRILLDIDASLALMLTRVEVFLIVLVFL